MAVVPGFLLHSYKYQPVAKLWRFLVSPWLFFTGIANVKVGAAFARAEERERKRVPTGV